MTLRQTMRRPVFDRAIASLRNFHRLKFSRGSLTIACLILAGLIGYVDYLTGYKQSLLLFYFLPISLAAWFANFKFGIAIVAVCVMVWVLSDLASGIPALEFWNIGTAFASYVLFAGVVSKLATLVRELDRRVDERTAAYERETIERRRLDQEIAQVADRERRRLGHDLHDKLGQHLTGTALAAQVLKEKLAARSDPDTGDAEKVVRCLEEGIDFSRNLARGFFSPELKAEGASLCTMELEPTEGAVKLSITHTIEREPSQFIAAVSGGWPKIMSNLKSLLETGSIALQEPYPAANARSAKG